MVVPGVRSVPAHAAVEAVTVSGHRGSLRAVTVSAQTAYIDLK
jgi:hypothetical protein